MVVVRMSTSGRGLHLQVRASLQSMRAFVSRHEMEDYKRMGLLTQLTICESMPEMKSDKSRDVYVQDALRRDAHKVRSVL